MKRGLSLGFRHVRATRLLHVTDGGQASLPRLKAVKVASGKVAFDHRSRHATVFRLSKQE